jgi:enoyl-CoA hydratase/carnithine racemase
MIRIEDRGRVRVITLDRPEALNSFNDALYDAAADALNQAATAPGIAVVVITGQGRAFSTGADLVEMAARNAGTFEGGRIGFPGFVDAVIGFPKPVMCAVNGMAIGIGATMLALVDMVFMSTDAKVRCPFTRLGVVPEAGSSVTFPTLLGRQNATWALLSSEWLGAEECVRMGLAFKACAPDDLMPETMRHAEVLAAKPISSLVESKRVIMAPVFAGFAEARERENGGFAKLMGGPANIEALTAFAQKREPDFGAVND